MYWEGTWIKNDADKIANEKGNDKAQNVAKSHETVFYLFWIN